MTKEEKLTKSGICPVCGSDNVDFGDVEFSGETNYQVCCCCECDCEWNEIYTFTEKEIVNKED